MPHYDQFEVTVRLECLKLAHRHDKTAPEVAERARDYEAYVFDLEGQNAGNPKGPATTANKRRARTPKTT